MPECREEVHQAGMLSAFSDQQSASHQPRAVIGAVIRHFDFGRRRSRLLGPAMKQQVRHWPADALVNGTG